MNWNLVKLNTDITLACRLTEDKSSFGEKDAFTLADRGTVTDTKTNVAALKRQQ